jgi:hypothetical protein
MVPEKITTRFSFTPGITYFCNYCHCAAVFNKEKICLSSRHREHSIAIIEN